MATRSATAVVVAAVLAGVAHLAVGYVYAASGLVVPGYALVLLWTWWGVQAWVLLRLARRRSCWVLAVPVVAGMSWWLVLMTGGALLGWTA